MMFTLCFNFFTLGQDRFQGIKMQIVSVALLVALLSVSVDLSAVEQDHNDSHEEPLKGPHNGRLLVQDDLTLELAIFERGVPPEYRAWVRYKGETLAPEQLTLSVSLRRLGGKVDDFTFTRQGDYLLGSDEVREPHSFDVTVNLVYQGKNYTWAFDSHEGRVEIPADIAEKSGVRSQVAGPGMIHETVHLYGRLVTDPQSTRRVSARFPGVIHQVYVNQGDRLKTGSLLAEVEANASLKRYEIRAPISGTVVKRQGNPGELVSSEPLFVIADHRHLWAELMLFPQHAGLFKAGQEVLLDIGGQVVNSHVDHVNPGAGETLNAVARVTLGNKNHQYLPGLFVEADIIVGGVNAPLVVDNRALQTFRDWVVVFIQIGESYEIRPLTLGRSDGRFTEILAGLKPGDRYVVENSYLLKADLEKSGASHDH